MKSLATLQRYVFQIYRITAAMMVKMDIIASPIGRTVLLVKMYVKTFITDVLVFIGNTLPYNFQYQSQSVDTDNIPL